MDKNELIALLNSLQGNSGRAGNNGLLGQLPTLLGAGAKSFWGAIAPRCWGGGGQPPPRGRRGPPAGPATRCGPLAGD